MTTFTTPAIASEPYGADAPSRSTSTRSIARSERLPDRWAHELTRGSDRVASGAASRLRSTRETDRGSIQRRPGKPAGGRMNAGRRPIRAAVWITIALLAGVGACSGDIAGEMSRNAQVRDRVMHSIAADSALAVEMTEHLLGNDALRRRVVETMLADDRSAQYVLARIGSNPAAVDYVLQAAASDSAGREHLMTLLKGMQIALRTKK